jgi:hypothetical protein
VAFKYVPRVKDSISFPAASKAMDVSIKFQGYDSKKSKKMFLAVFNKE